MDLKTILLAGFGASVLYFGGSVFHENRKITDYYNTHHTLKQYLYLEQYDQVLTQISQSYAVYATNETDAKTKEYALKTGKDLQLALVHIKQQKHVLEGEKLLNELKELNLLTGKQQRDNSLFIVSLLGITGILAWKWLAEKEA